MGGKFRTIAGKYLLWPSEEEMFLNVRVAPIDCIV